MTLASEAENRGAHIAGLWPQRATKQKKMPKEIELDCVLRLSCVVCGLWRITFDWMHEAGWGGGRPVPARLRW